MKLKTIFISIFLGTLVGCQTAPYKPYARKVKVKPRQGGVVALKLDHVPADRTYAEGIMTNTCGSSQAYRVLEEGEVVIGTETSSKETRQSGKAGVKLGFFGIPVSTGSRDPEKNTNSTTIQKKEWQISYRCKNVARKKRSNKTIR